MISDEKIDELRKELDECSKPLIFFDDDCDGLASFVLLYRYKREGKGVPIKAAPTLNENFLKYVETYGPDKIFVLDNSRISEDFVAKAKTKIICLDHHPYERLDGVKYYNPKDFNEAITWPTSYWAYKIASKENNEDIWIGMLGCIGDWFMPDFKDEFCELYPDLMDKSIEKPDDALFHSEIGRLAQAFYFVLKGSTKIVLSCMKILTRIDSPYEILEQKTPQGKYIYKHYDKVLKHYNKLLSMAKKSVTEDRIIVFTYDHDNTSMTAEVSNELIHTYPEKIVVVGRRKNSEYRCSIRSAGETLVAPALEKILESIDGYGGGHDHACGAAIKEEDFGRFIEMLRDEFR
ncbi:MAG: DHH family phosphoesterase [Candidatus Woesearchaeota archaeon]